MPLTSAGTKWRDQAACQRVDVRVFFPAGEDAALLARAKAVCHTCPVMSVCLEAGLREPEGVWGGLSPRERSVLVGRLSPRTTSA